MMNSLTASTEASGASYDRDLLWIGASVLLWLAYALIFAGTQNEPLGRAFRDAAVNVLPLMVVAQTCRIVLPRLLAGRSAAVQAATHVLGAVIFSATWYGSVTILFAALHWTGGHEFRLIGFEGPALAWQVFQGAILYCAVAAIVLRAELAPPSGVKRTPGLRRYLIKDGEDLRPVEVAQIVTIRGAQDYSEVATASGRHLVRMNLALFEARLNSEQFIRVHRSAIVHLAYLDRLEPAGGGRMLAHMRNGEVVSVSRAGAQALRSLVV